MLEQIAIVIPAYNEAANISQVVAQVRPFAAWVIVVDDGSKDNTFLLAKAAGAVSLRHKVNRGQGAALQTGNQKALALGARIIVHFDGDGQFLASDIPALCQPLIENQADIVFGSRFLKLGNKLPFTKKTIIIPLARLINRLFWGIKTSDPQSGLRALSQKAATEIVIENDGMAHCSEILIKAKQYKYRILEVPTSVIYHRFGQSFGGGIKIVKDLIYKKIIK